MYVEKIAQTRRSQVHYCTDLLYVQTVKKTVENKIEMLNNVYSNHAAMLF